MTTAWHIDPGQLARYARAELDDVPAASIEAHLLACDGCRTQIAPAVPSARLDRTWGAVLEVIDAPRVGAVERLLVWVGLRDHVARLLAATPSLRLSWILAEALALGSAALAAHAASGRHGEGGWLFLFLVLASLTPVAGVAVAFGQGVDPAYEIGIASPMRSDRLLLIRSAAVLAASLVIGAIAALALPGLDRTVALWLLPALGLTAATLTAATWMHPVKAACAVGLGWLVIAAAVSAATSDPLAVFGAADQLAYLLLLAASLLILARRRTAYEGRIPQ
jgi:hypothetical protein